MNLVLERMPDRMSLSLKALGSVRRTPKPETELPPMSVALAGVRFDAGNLAAYRDICGFAETGAVPIPYPQVHAIGLQLHLLTQPQFPLPLAGLVHLKNRIVQQRGLAPDEAFDVQVALVASRTTDKGLEFDLETTYKDKDDKVCWTAVATVLRRRKQADRKKAPPRAEETDRRLAEYRSVDAPGDIGRRYGRISGDMNPIHLYPLTAKLLGFDRHIAHGMWSMARCCGLLQDGLGREPKELSVQFRQPLFLPARATLSYGKVDGRFAFALIGRDSGKTHLTGRLA